MLGAYQEGEPSYLVEVDGPMLNVIGVLSAARSKWDAFRIGLGQTSVALLFFERPSRISPTIWDGEAIHSLDRSTMNLHGRGSGQPRF